MFYDLTIRTPNYSRKIYDIKALREMTRLPVAPGSVAPGAVMNLTDAKNAIEAGYVEGSFVLRLTPEQYAAWCYNANYATYNERDWSLSSVKAVFPETEPKFFTV